LYLRSHKWSSNPIQLQKLIRNELQRSEAQEYAREIVSEQMPLGLKHHIESVILPCFQLKPCVSGLLLSSMSCLMLQEGFEYTEHKKAIYFDGHEHLDVTKDRADCFIPDMLAIQPYLVRYKIDAVEYEAPPNTAAPANVFVRPRLVLVAHDEMTAQAHDGVKASWVPTGEQPLKKKGPRRGLHQSEFICSTVGHLEDAGQTLKYGKNHEGYWNGEMFCKQVCHAFLYIHNQ
jgi:hypothetical protein